MSLIVRVTLVNNTFLRLHSTAGESKSCPYISPADTTVSRKVATFRRVDVIKRKVTEG